MLRNIACRGHILNISIERIATGIAILAFIMLSCGLAAAQGTTWNVLVGGETQDMAMQGMGFYPAIITINEGDTVKWTLGGSEPHTVGFLSGAQSPQPGSHESLAPAGGSIYNGTGFVSSGIITPGMNYSLNFTKPGFYAYQCLIHPGMAGVVIVKPAGSPYPFTQEQYTAQGKKELKLALELGHQLAENLNVISSPGPNGTTIWQAFADIPMPENANVILEPRDNSSAAGSAALNFVGPGTLQVQIQLSGLAPNSTHPAHIHTGSCEAGGPIAIPLNDVIAGPDGKAKSTTTITGPPWFAIAGRGWFINVHQGPTMSDGGATPISCGDVIKHNAGYMRFTTGTLKIHTGDTVVWTQLNPMEIHTVTFPVPGQPVPEFILPDLSINPVAAAPAGGNIHNGTRFYNSGILQPGQKYTLMFAKPGTYDYLCLIHDDMGMIGKIVVLPPGGSISGTKFDDINGNRIKDQDEKGLPGWTIELAGFDKHTMTSVKRSTVTDADGNYNFADLSEGFYVVSEVMQPGWVPATPPVSPVHLENGESAVVDFGNRRIIQ